MFRRIDPTKRFAVLQRTPGTPQPIQLAEKVLQSTKLLRDLAA